MSKKNGQADQPATKGDVQEAVDELAQITDKNFRQVDQRLDEHDKRFDKIDRVLKMILAIVKGIDQDRKEEKKHNLPERVKNLEDDVLKIKARVY